VTPANTRSVASAVASRPYIALARSPAGECLLSVCESITSVEVKQEDGGMFPSLIFCAFRIAATLLCIPNAMICETILAALQVTQTILMMLTEHLEGKAALAIVIDLQAAMNPVEPDIMAELIVETRSDAIRNAFVRELASSLTMLVKPVRYDVRKSL
jgi:hypothetical protein